MIIRSAYLLDAEFRVVADRAVRVAGDRIVEIVSGNGLCGDDVLDLGDVLLMPGLVNAHAHLELGFARDRVAPGDDFADWLGRLLAEIRGSVGDEAVARNAVIDGLRESLTAGTTLLGDITRSPAFTRQVIAEQSTRPAVVSFGEVIAIGGLRSQANERIAAACSPTADDESARTTNLHVGISPHAPYTVAPDVLRECAHRAADRELPLCIHAAETPEEEQFTRDAAGPLSEHLARVGVWDDSIRPTGMGPIELIANCGALTSRTLLAHVNYATASDIARIAAADASVAYCPRTHAAFKHAPHPFRDMLARNVNVCLGTDSLASNPSLSLLDELRFVFAHNADVDPVQLVRMATLNGAKALGMAAHTGQITTGMRADLIALPLPSAASPRTNSASIVTEALTTTSPPSFVMVAGCAAS